MHHQRNQLALKDLSTYQVLFNAMTSLKIVLLTQENYVKEPAKASEVLQDPIFIEESKVLIFSQKSHSLELDKKVEVNDKRMSKTERREIVEKQVVK